MNHVVIYNLYGQWYKATHYNGREMIYKTHKAAAKAALRLWHDMKHQRQIAVTSCEDIDAEFWHTKIGE